MSEPRLLWVTWRPWPEGIASKWTTHGQRQIASLEWNPTRDYHFGAFHTCCLQVFPFSYKNSSLLFPFRKFKLSVILRSKHGASGRPCEGQESVPARGWFPLTAGAAPGTVGRRTHARFLQRVLSAEIRAPSQAAQWWKKANPRNLNCSYLAGAICQSVFSTPDYVIVIWLPDSGHSESVSSYLGDKYLKTCPF